jgi:hypothetical protein
MFFPGLIFAKIDAKKQMFNFHGGNRHGRSNPKEVKVMQKTLSICLILMMIIQFSGCAKTTSPATSPVTTSPPVPVAQINNVGDLPEQKTQYALRVGADPYYSNRQKEMFGQDMSRTGLLPVMVYLQNNGEQPIKVMPSTISLRLPEGGEAGSSALPYNLLPPPPPSDTTGAKVGRAALVGGVILFPRETAFVLALTGKLDEKDKPRLRKEFQNKELREVTLAKGETAQGFIYFYVPQGVQRTVGAELIVPYLPAKGKGGEVRVRLGGK